MLDAFKATVNVLAGSPTVALLAIGLVMSLAISLVLGERS